MKNLVTTLKAQHQVIAHFVGLVDRALEAKDAALVTKELETLKTLLLTHLELEHRELYPALMTGARRNPATVETARQFEENILRISEAATAFFGRHLGGTLDLTLFAREWRMTVGMIAGRCESEEAQLYPLYEKMTRIGPGTAEVIRQAS